MSLSPDEILTIVKAIYEAPPRLNKSSVFRAQYPDFAENYKTIFDMACTSDFDFARFSQMIVLKKSIDAGKMTQYDASAKVGGVLYDAYVKPNLQNVPDTQQQ